MKLFIISAFILPLIVAIGILDYVVISRWLKCEFCHHEVRWTQFILPTFIEVFLFIAGIYVGYQIGIGG